MKPRLFSIIAVIATFVGGIVTGTWLNERKQRADTGEFVEWVTGDEMAAALAGLSEFGIAPKPITFNALPSRALEISLHDVNTIPGVTAYLTGGREPRAAGILETSDGSIILHHGQWIDLRPAMQALDTAGV